MPTAIAAPKTPLKPRVFVYGNSLVWGVGASDGQHSFPARLKLMLGERWEASDWVGRGGWSTPQLAVAARYDLAPYTAEVGRARKVLVFWEGTNDMGAMPCESYEDFTRVRVAEGWSVVLLTALPTKATEATSDGGPSSLGTKRQAFNECVRKNAASWGAVGVVDVAAIPELGDPWDPSYYVDGVHGTDLLYSRVATEVARTVDPLYVAPSE